MDARATARAVVAEMHAGFLQALRAQHPMNVRAAKPDRTRDGSRHPPDHGPLEQLPQALRRCGRRRPVFLFGAWSAADAFYAPVVSRFTTYCVDGNAVCRAYMEAVLKASMVAKWFAAARAEPWTAAKYDTL